MQRFLQRGVEPLAQQGEDFGNGLGALAGKEIERLAARLFARVPGDVRGQRPGRLGQQSGKRALKLGDPCGVILPQRQRGIGAQAAARLEIDGFIFDAAAGLVEQAERFFIKRRDGRSGERRDIGADSFNFAFCVGRVGQTCVKEPEHGRSSLMGFFGLYLLEMARVFSAVPAAFRLEKTPWELRRVLESERSSFRMSSFLRKSRRLGLLKFRAPCNSRLLN